MKKVLNSLVLLTAAALGLSAADLKTKIPFDFTAGNQNFSAGRYSIGRGAAPNVLQLTDRQTGQKFFVYTVPAQLKTGETPKLVFHRYGDGRVFLAEVYGDWGTGQKLPVTKLERELMSKTTHERVVVGAME